MPLKPAVLIITLVLLIAPCSHALRIETESKRGAFYGYTASYLVPGTTIMKSIGKLRGTDYGIILNVEYFDESLGERGRRENKVAFYHLIDARLERQEDSLFLVTAERRKRIAERGFLRWKLLPGVTIRHEAVPDFGTLTITVWLEVE